MRNYNIHFKFGLCLVACMPLSSHAALEVPYWLYPEWIVTKVVDFHTRNTDRLEIAQKQEKAKNVDKFTRTDGPNTANSANGTSTPAAETTTSKPKLAPVEYATPKINEKQLTKEELQELRMQLRQKP
jgi:hypothetical protein